MEENKLKTYLRGLALLLALILVGIVVYIVIFAIELTIFFILLIIFIIIAIIALILMPYFYARNFEVKSKNFKLKEVKKKEKL
jgi:Zn-dependent protease with chaperone function